MCTCLICFTFYSHNRLSGPVPPVSASVLRRLEISVSHNLLSGEIPAGPGDEPFDISSIRLRLIDYSYNLISGTPRPNIAYLPSLHYLDFSGNLLTGSFVDIASWQSLEYIGYGKF
jgi:Leucine-rich repeat (LRR) protein